MMPAWGSAMPPDLPGLAPVSERFVPGVGGTRSWRRPGQIIAAFLLSALAGLACAYFHYLLVIGAVAGLLGAYAVLRWPFVGLILYTIIYYWRPGETYPVLSLLRLELVIGALALTAMVTQRYRASGVLYFDQSRLTRYLLLVLLAVAVSVPLAYYRSAAMDGLVDFLKLMIWYALVAHLLTTRLRFRIYVTVFLMAISKLALDGLRAYFAGNFKYAQGIDRLVGQTSAGGDPNTLAVTCAATIPILIMLLIEGRFRWYKLFPAAGLCLLMVTIALSGSRSGFLAFFAGLIFLWAGIRHRLFIGLVGAALIAFGLVALPDQYKTRYTSITSSEIDASSQGRLDAWEDGMRMVADRPLTGVGIRCYTTARAMDYSGVWLQPHNVYVQVLSEIGIIGGLFFFAFIFEMIRAGVRSRRRPDAERDQWWFENGVLWGISAGVIALLVGGIFGHSFMRHTWYLYGALVVAIARLRADPLARNSTSTRPSTLPGIH